MVVIHF